MEEIYVKDSSKELTDEGNKFPLLIEFFVNITSAVVIFLVIYFFVAQPHQVEGSSMLPNFHSGDYVLTEKITERFNGFQRGDIVVFNYPKNPEFDYIKRVIALPGDLVKITNGQVFVNNLAIEEPYLVTSSDQNANTSNTVKANSSSVVLGTTIPATHGSAFLLENEEYQVAVGEMIVMGDNRGESSDSREWGPVKLNQVVGKVFFRYWPFSQIGLVNN